MVAKKPECVHCGNPLQISDAALRAMEKLGRADRPATCAKCAVDKTTNSNKGVVNK